MAPTPVFDESTSTMNRQEGSGWVRAGAEEKLCLRCWKAASAGGDQENEHLEEVRAWTETATEIKFLINYL